MAFEKEILGFWERLINMKDKYGYWSLTKMVLFVGFTIAFFYAAKNFGENFSIEQQREVITEVMDENYKRRNILHAEHMKMREQIKPYVSGLLKSTLNEMNADRAFVIELHNGSNNTAGLPFIHCTMTYEEDARGIEAIDEDYQNLSLSRFTFPEYLHEHNLWLGTIEDFGEIDPKVTSRMLYNNVTYLVITTIRSDNNEIGYYGFTYCKGKKPEDEKVMIDFVFNSVQKLSKWLDKDVKDR